MCVYVYKVFLSPIGSDEAKLNLYCFSPFYLYLSLFSLVALAILLDNMMTALIYTSMTFIDTFTNETSFGLVIHHHRALLVVMLR